MDRIEEPNKVQSIEAYENDPIMDHLFDTLSFLSIHDSVYFGIARILEYRERMYPKLFPMSIDASKLDDTSTTRTKLYIEAAENRAFK